MSGQPCRPSAGGPETEFLQVSLNLDKAEAERAIGALDGLGALSVSIRSADDEDTYDEAISDEPRWLRQNLVALFGPETDVPDLEESLARTLPGHPVRFSSLKDRDWERAWLDMFVPQRIAPGLWVVPSWLAPPDPGAVNLVIDPGLAFGTGTHPTTRMCLEYMDRLDLAGKRVLDYGCGSGILAIAALKLGAASAVATDLDPRALEACLENARVNQCAGRILAVPPENLAYANGMTPADVVVANILGSTLLTLRDRLCALLAPQGLLLLSGILTHQADEVEDAYRGLLEFSRVEQSGWVLLAGTSRS